MVRQMPTPRQRLRGLRGNRGGLASRRSSQALDPPTCQAVKWDPPFESDSEERASRASRRLGLGRDRASWFETREDALLTMRGNALVKFEDVEIIAERPRRACAPFLSTFLGHHLEIGLRLLQH